MYHINKLNPWQSWCQMQITACGEFTCFVDLIESGKNISVNLNCHNLRNRLLQNVSKSVIHY